MVGSVVLWVILPAAALLAVGFVGTALDPDAAMIATPLLFLALFFGVPAAGVRLGRWTYRDVNAPRRLRMPSAHQLRPPPAYPAPPEAVEHVSARARVTGAALVVAMFLVALAMWTVAPVGSVWLGSLLAETTQPSAGPYLVILASVPLSMGACGLLLYLLNERYVRVRGTGRQERRSRSPWLKSISDSRPIAARSTLELILIASVASALVCMAVWFFFFAELQSAAQWYLD